MARLKLINGVRDFIKDFREQYIEKRSNKSSILNNNGKVGMRYMEWREREDPIRKRERFTVSSYDANKGRTPDPAMTDLLAVYTTNVWVYDCIFTIANSAASVPWTLSKKEGDVWVETQDTELEQTLENPNPFMSWFDLIEATMIFMECTGLAFWEKVAKPNGELDKLFPLRTDKVTIFPDPKHLIAGFEFTPDGGMPERFEPDEIAMFKYFNPLDDFDGLAPTEPAISAITLDFWAIAFNKNFFKNSAIPEFAIIVPGALSDEAANRIEADVIKKFQGVEKSHGFLILEDGMDIKLIGVSQKDMQFIEQRKFSREEILSAYGVPPIMVGILESANYATAKQQKQTFWQETMIPKLKKLEGAINRQIMPDDVWFQFNYAEIEAMIEDVDIKINSLESQVGKGIITINEARAELGRKPVPWGDVWWASVGLAPVSAQDGRATRSEEHMLGDLDDVLQSDESKNDNPKIQKRTDSLNFFKQQIPKDIKLLRRKLTAFFEDQQDEIIRNIKRSGIFKSVKTEIRKVDETVDRFLLDLGKEGAVFEEMVLEDLQGIMAKHGNRELARLETGLSFDLKDERLVRFLGNWKNKRIRDINLQTNKILQKSLAEGVRAGEGLGSIVGRVKNVFGGDIAKGRAEKIARTEVITFSNKGRLESYEQSGVVKQKEWVSLLLDSTRESHEFAHGQIKNIGEPFEIESRLGGVDLMQSPGDLGGSVDNVVNCLCVVEPIVEL